VSSPSFESLENQRRTEHLKSHRTGMQAATQMSRSDWFCRGLASTLTVEPTVSVCWGEMTGYQPPSPAGRLVPRTRGPRCGISGSTLLVCFHLDRCRVSARRRCDPLRSNNTRILARSLVYTPPPRVVWIDRFKAAESDCNRHALRKPSTAEVRQYMFEGLQELR
jgi:hypothetical protein